MIHKDDISTWVDDLEDFKSLGFTYSKCNSLLMFFTLAGKHTILSKDNLIPVPDIHFALYSLHEKRYYLKEYHGWNIDTLYYLRPSLTFGGLDESVTSLRNWVVDGNVWILYDNSQIGNMSTMLRRVWKSHLEGEGQLRYRDFLKILELSLKIEDYTLYYKGSIGYLTQVHIWQQELVEIWRKISLNEK